MLKLLMISLVLLSPLLPAAAQENQAAPKAAPADSLAIPAEAAHQVNPVKPTSASIDQGKKYYGYDCAMCHGDNGNGKGEVAISEKLTIGDFQNPATLKNKTDGELFYMINKGHAHMPPEQIRISPNELWNLVNYIRSLSTTKAP